MRLFKYCTLILVTLGAGCTENSYTIDVSPLANRNVPTVSTAILYPEWTTITAGAEIKQILITVNSARELFTIVRFSPSQHPMNIAVDRTHPKTITQWQETLNAAVVINGNYFDEKYAPTTRVVVKGETEGPYLSGNTGMVYTENSDARQWVITKANKTDLNAAWLGIQSYPLLVNDSAVSFTTGSDDVAQRTIIAQDNQGKMYYITTEYGVLSLNQLANILATQLDLTLTQALNLDGGTSTGVAIHTTTVTYNEDSAPVPVVLYFQ